MRWRAAKCIKMRGDGTKVSCKCALVGWDREIGNEARYLRKMVDVIIIGYWWESGSRMFYFCACGDGACAKVKKNYV